MCPLIEYFTNPYLIVNIGYMVTLIKVAKILAERRTRWKI